MGYDPGRFISAVNEEFHCSICTLVLEEPMQSPCEHIFCNKCIKDWLKVKTICPVDNNSLTLDEMKPTPRYFRNILDKMEIRCDFGPKRCEAIVILEQLKDHLAKCLINPEAEVTCDKGCNIKMTRHEYEVNNCFIHLANWHQIQLDKITRREQEMIAKTRILWNATPKWRICEHMKISVCQPHILEYDSSGSDALAQIFFSLDPGNSVFKVKVLNVVPNNYIIIGLARKDLPIIEKREYNNISIGYCSTGNSLVNSRFEKKGQEWKNGDIIECGIIFPKNFINDVETEVEVNFSVNEHFVFKNLIKIPLEGFFPTVYMFSHGNVPINGAVSKAEFLDLNFLQLSQ